LNIQQWHPKAPNMPMNYAFPFPLLFFTGTHRGTGPGAIDQVPRAPMYAPSTSAGIFVGISSFNDTDPAGAVGLLNAYIMFWEFDLEQIRKYPVNAPIPTHAR